MRKANFNRFLGILLFVLIDIFTVAFSWMMSLLLTSSSIMQCLLSQKFWLFFFIGCLVFILSNVGLKLYSKLLRYIDIYDTIKIIISIAISCVYSGIIALVMDELTFPWFIVSVLLFTIITFGIRFAYRVYAMINLMAQNAFKKKNCPRVMIVGAGSAGSMLIKELQTTKKITLNPVCVLDDDVMKLDKEVMGVKVVGTTKEIEQKAKQYKIDQIIIAIPSVSRKRIAEIIKECQKTKCKTRIIPGIYQMVQGAVKMSAMKDIDVEDLLGRDPVKVNLDEIAGYIENKVVLVTGGGGSIGSELCRQVVKYKPKQFIIVDNYENNAYDIQQELKSKYKDLDLVVLIATVRERNRLEEIFAKYKPEIVFHAAAHKHVPLMEDSPTEAVKNNIGGTFNTADVAGKYGVKKFIFISTDKAVNPTNVMGATKRVCEMIIQSLNKKYDTEYVAVRFGNVLGSNGSVVPLFKKQIAEGGPVTLTDEKIVRYFMTIPEAVSLVLQAGAFAKGGEIFVLDMGNPVKIYDLAVNMIKLSGYKPFEDIDIVITGLRPGEKLYEERLMDEEGLQKTSNELISIGKPIEFDENKLLSNIKAIVSEANNETEDIVNKIKELVPTFLHK
ncbi:MAG: polysaccharide biosynthesis protein [Clostridia bacterium]|nr:polysaccharide biosynthesis protein [Clostridia bacterium]